MRTGILPALIVGLAFTALSVPLDDGGRQLGQYVATAAFVAAWGFARYGLWRNEPDWRAAAHRQTALWFGGFLTAAVILGALDEVQMAEGPSAHQGAIAPVVQITYLYDPGR
jgi:hypothetical protein